MIAPKNSLRFWQLAVIFLFLALSLTLNFVLARAENSWAHADWLINYESGFVRRGLGGQLLIQLASATKVSLSTLVAIVQSIGSLVLVAIFLKLIWKVQSEPAKALLFFSPMLLFFQISDFGAAGRKDWLFIFVFYLLISAYANKTILFSITLASFLITLIHEANALFFLAGLTYLFISGKIQRLYFIGLSIPNLLALTYFLVSAPPRQVGARMCQSLLDYGYSIEVCEGAIYFLDNSAKEGIAFTVSTLANPESVLEIILLISLLCLSTHMLSRFLGSQLTLKDFVWVITPILPLFISSVDWGRWISVVFWMFTIILLFDHIDHRRKHPTDNSNQKLQTRYIPFFATIALLYPMSVVPGQFSQTISSLFFLFNRALSLIP